MTGFYDVQNKRCLHNKFVYNNYVLIYLNSYNGITSITVLHHTLILDLVYITSDNDEFICH